MKVKLERLPKDVETYSVQLIEDDGEGSPAVIGTVSRVHDTEWSFVAANVVGGHAPAIQIEAADGKALAQAIAMRFGAIDLPADRLRIETMRGLVGAQLAPLVSLAKHTKSLSGVYRALATQVGELVVLHGQPGSDTELLATFNRMVEQEVASARATKAMAAQLESIFREVFPSEEQKGGDSDGPETKH